jgi:hypothetical protein
MTGPVMVVEREATLASGAADLVALTRRGELLVIEFKMGPRNPDFRRAIAELLDYGSDLWDMSYEQFENAVARPYFKGGDGGRSGTLVEFRHSDEMSSLSSTSGLAGHWLR